MQGSTCSQFVIWIQIGQQINLIQKIIVLYHFISWYKEIIINETSISFIFEYLEATFYPTLNNRLPIICKSNLSSHSIPWISHQGVERREFSWCQSNTHAEHRRPGLQRRYITTTLRPTDMHAIKDSLSHRPLSYSNRYFINTMYPVDIQHISFWYFLSVA